MEARPGFERRMTRDEINRLPIQVYEGPILIIDSQDELKSAIKDLLRESVLGFDTESKPVFTKGQSSSPALLQLAGHDAVYIFQLGQLKFPSLLREILSTPGIIKAGVGLDHDIYKLKGLWDFKPAGFIDLSDLARHNGIKNYGLRGLTAILLGFRISKQAQVSNWTRKNLSPKQIQYAATDAWVSRELYLRLEDNGHHGKKHHKTMGGL